VTLACDIDVASRDVLLEYISIKLATRPVFLGAATWTEEDVVVLETMGAVWANGVEAVMGEMGVALVVVLGFGTRGELGAVTLTLDATGLRDSTSTWFVLMGKALGVDVSTLGGCAMGAVTIGEEGDS